jgi:hypothetical protein
MSPVELQNLIASYNTYYEQGQMSKEELVSLLQGITIMEDVGDMVESLETKEQMNLMLNAAISAASMLA